MLKLWREKPNNGLYLDTTPTGGEEERFLYGQEVEDPRDLNAVVILERIQDMDERKLYADRAFAITLVWVFFLVGITVAQFFKGVFGLSDAQFVTVVTTTTASVFGFMFLVGRYLHRQNGENDDN